MARTPISAFGRLVMNYEAYGKPHILRVYVPDFNSDPTIGTFVASATPASLDALATELTNVIRPLYQSASGLVFGDWLGEFHTSGESFIPVVNGSITDAGAAYGSTVLDQPGAPSQATFTFRNAGHEQMRIELLGVIYVASTVFRYGGLGGAFLNFANYVLGSVRIKSRAALAITAMVSLTFDTNDGLQRRYRR